MRIVEENLLIASPFIDGNKAEFDGQKKERVLRSGSNVRFTS